MHFIHGKLNGRFETFYVCSGRALDAEFRDGVLHGDLKFWFQNNQVTPQIERKYILGAAVPK